MAIIPWAKRVVGRVLPPAITARIQEARIGSTWPRLVTRAKRYPTSEGARVVAEAKQHLAETARATALEGMPQSPRWNGYQDRIRSRIDSLTTVEDIVGFAQSNIGFDHRALAVRVRPYLPLYERALRSEFPHFASALAGC